MRLIITNHNQDQEFTADESIQEIEFEVIPRETLGIVQFIFESSSQIRLLRGPACDEQLFKKFIKELKLYFEEEFDAKISLLPQVPQLSVASFEPKEAISDQVNDIAFRIFKPKLIDHYTEAFLEDAMSNDSGFGISHQEVFSPPTILTLDEKTKTENLVSMSVNFIYITRPLAKCFFEENFQHFQTSNADIVLSPCVGEQTAKMFLTSLSRDRVYGFESLNEKEEDLEYHREGWDDFISDIEGELWGQEETDDLSRLTMVAYYWFGRITSGHNKKEGKYDLSKAAYNSIRDPNAHDKNFFKMLFAEKLLLAQPHQEQTIDNRSSLQNKQKKRDNDEEHLFQHPSVRAIGNTIDFAFRRTTVSSFQGEGSADQASVELETKGFYIDNPMVEKTFKNTLSLFFGRYTDCSPSQKSLPKNADANDPQIVLISFFHPEIEKEFTEKFKDEWRRIEQRTNP